MSDQQEGGPVASALESAEARDAFAQMMSGMDDLYAAFSVLTRLAAAVRGAHDESVWANLFDQTKTLLPEEFTGVGDFHAAVRGVNGDEVEFAWSVSSILRADRDRGLGIVNLLYKHFLSRALELSLSSAQALTGFSELLQLEAVQQGLIKLTPRKPRGKKAEVPDEDTSAKPV